MTKKRYDLKEHTLSRHRDCFASLAMTRHSRLCAVPAIALATAGGPRRRRGTKQSTLSKKQKLLRFARNDTQSPSLRGASATKQSTP